MNQVRILCAVPSARNWCVEFGVSMVGLTLKLPQQKNRVDHFQFKSYGGGSLACRQMAVNEAVDGGFSHLLFLDDDMQFPYTALDDLMGHDLDFVCANYTRRVSIPTAAVCLGMDGKYLNSQNKTGLEEAKYGALGLALIKTSALALVKPPHFEMIYNEHFGRPGGEDYYFCDRLREKGVKFYVDHDLSNNTYHMGTFAYGFHLPQVETGEKHEGPQQTKAEEIAA